ncbi:transposase [Neolewinella litorea]|uniref:Mutator family transposase n=1 Tax=Neolewinella litorea TaxID=2562452 RepID=A0A4S4NA65_9BACT|nr:transposase [Neolewinella litorea]THH35555.1 transposase [Neolewinella litorea]
MNCNPFRSIRGAIQQYPKIIASWRRNWDNLTLMFNYSPLIRKVIYTTNAIEAFHRQLRRVTKTKGSFTSDTALMKLLYLVQRDVTAKWKKPMHNWNRILSQLAILYDDRLRLDRGLAKEYFHCKKNQVTHFLKYSLRKAESQCGNPVVFFTNVK